MIKNTQAYVVRRKSADIDEDSDNVDQAADIATRVEDAECLSSSSEEEQNHPDFKDYALGYKKQNVTDNWIKQNDFKFQG